VDVGETTLSVGEQTTLGPMRIEIGAAPSPIPPQAHSPIGSLLSRLIYETRKTNDLLLLIYQHQTRPSLWRRFTSWVKKLCGVQ